MDVSDIDPQFQAPAPVLQQQRFLPVSGVPSPVQRMSLPEKNLEESDDVVMAHVSASGRQQKTRR